MERARKVWSWLADRGLGVTLGVALLVKVYLLFIREYVIVNDGMLYVTWIAKICENGWRAAFTEAYPFNLFPLSAALVHKASGGLLGYEESALAINFVCGLLTLVPVYLLAKRHFGRAAALVSGLYVALHPIYSEISCQVLREASAICLGLWALYFLVVAIEDRNPAKWCLWRLGLAFVLILGALMIRLEMLVLLGVGTSALLFSHWRKGRPYGLWPRLRILLLAGSILLLCAGAAFAGIRVVKGRWDFARIDKIFSAQAMGEQKYDVADPLKPSAEIYDANGQPIPLARTRYAFAHLAWDHQRALFGYEILYKTWKTIHPVGLALFLLALYFLVKREPLERTAPVNICTLTLAVIMAAVYYRYVSTKFAVSNRHIVLPVFLFAVYMGLPVNYLVLRERWQKLLLAAAAAAALAMLTYKAFRPLEHHRLPLKRYGQELKGKLPEKSILLEADGLRHVAYYAGLKHKMWAGQTGEEIVSQMRAKENMYLLVDFMDQHAAVFQPMEDRFELVTLVPPADSRHQLAVYRLAPGGGAETENKTQEGIKEAK